MFQFKYLIMGGYLFAAIGALSCNQVSVAKPDNLLHDTIVQNILLEMYLVEAAIRVNLFEQDNNQIRAWTQNEINRIMKQYQTSYEQFNQSLSHYMRQKDQKILDHILNRLVKMELEAEASSQTENKSDINQSKIISHLNSYTHEEDTNGRFAGAISTN